MRQILKGFLMMALVVRVQGAIAQTQPIEPAERDKSEQDSENSTNKDWTDRFVVGGNLGAQFGQETYIEASPIIGYKVTDMLTMGVGFTYQYYKVNFNSPLVDDFAASVLGPRVFAQHDLIYNFFAHAEFEHAWVKYDFEEPLFQDQSWDVSALFVGAGYNYEIGENSRFQLMILYDLLNNINSVYYSPWVFRMGFNIGL